MTAQTGHRAPSKALCALRAPPPPPPPEHADWTARTSILAHSLRLVHASLSGNDALLCSTKNSKVTIHICDRNLVVQSLQRTQDSRHKPCRSVITAHSGPVTKTWPCNNYCTLWVRNRNLDVPSANTRLWNSRPSCRSAPNPVWLQTLRRGLPRSFPTYIKRLVNHTRTHSDQASHNHSAAERKPRSFPTWCRH